MLQFPIHSSPLSMHCHRQKSTSLPFVDGLGLPAASCLGIPGIQVLQSNLKSCPAILTYDRYGQGLTTARDPLDTQKALEYDFLDVASDLHKIITTVATSKLGFQSSGCEEGKLHMILIGASIGAPIARLYAQQHPGLAAGMILLDSNIPNADYSEFWPDPDAPGFDPETVVSEYCTIEQYRNAREKFCAMFDLKVKNAEGLDRSNSPDLLPRADARKLVTTDGKRPQLIVVGHDPETFAEMSSLMMGTSKSLSEKFTNAYWARYNEGLIQITDEGKCDGVVITKGCGHFIQKDDPGFVDRMVGDMIEKLGR